MTFQNYWVPKLDKYKTALNERTYSLTLVKKVKFCCPNFHSLKKNHINKSEACFTSLGDYKYCTSAQNALIKK